MKLSGGFSEMEKQDPLAPFTASQVVNVMKPWLNVLFSTFQRNKIMFGSDWPVCNVDGPGNAQSWSCWKAAVEETLEVYNLTDQEKDWIWYGTAVQAYRL